MPVVAVPGRVPVGVLTVRKTGALAGLLLGLLIAVALPAAPAHAHAVLRSSDPVAGTVVPQSPGRVTLTFTESVQPVNGRIQVLAPDNSRADDGRPAAADATVTITLNAQARGTYLVSYRVTSADSHPIAGSFVFSVGQPSAPPSAGDTTTAEVSPSVRAALPVAKGAGYAGLLFIIGPILVLSLLWPRRLSRVGPARLVWTGFGLVLASTVAGLLLQVPYTTGGGIGDVTLGGLRDVLGSTYGAVMLVRLGVLCAAAFLIRPLLAAQGGESRMDFAVLAVLGVAALSTWPLSGHPAGSPIAGVSVVIDAVHLTAMAVWLGGLVMLLGFLLPHTDDRELAAILPIWSRWAATAVGALVLAGTVQALIEIGAFGALVSTTYGRLLLAKAALVAVVLAVAGYARRLVHRRLADGRPALRRVVGVELGVTTVILALTAVLVQTTPARTATATPAAPAAPATTTPVEQTLRGDSLSLRVTVFPAQTGNNSVHLFAYTLDGKPLPVVEWRATAALPAAGIEPIEAPLLRITNNHATGDIGLPRAGDWQLRFILRTSDVDQTTLAGTVTVK